MQYGRAMTSHWIIQDADPGQVEFIRRMLDCHPILARLLANRGIASREAADAFLNPRFDRVTSPFAMQDMQPAVSRLCRAVQDREKILVFGDYDADGITATALLYQFLNACGADVFYYIPHRIHEGYGLQRQHITEVALPKRVRVIVTVDCGVSSHEAVALAAANRIDTIVTDHHDLPPRLPAALAVVNPKRRDCSAGLHTMAGVGVAFYLAVCLRTRLRESGFFNNHREPNLKRLCDLVALGTVADMVPLVKDNRILTKTGIDLIRAGQRSGLQALLKLCRVDPDFFDAEDIAFKIAPRLNAAGRFEHAGKSVSVLTTRNPDQAGSLALALDQLNQARRETEKNTLVAMQRLLQESPDLMGTKSIVLAHKTWHEGILGILASRLAKRYTRPVVVIATDGETAKGSARSVPGLNLFQALQLCASRLKGYGGHAMAAGLRLRHQDIGDFRREFDDAVVRMSGPAAFVADIRIDCRLDFNLISPLLMDEIEMLKPFGTGNPEPLFEAGGIKVLSSNVIGGTHRRMRLAQSASRGTPVFNAVHFNAGPLPPGTSTLRKVAFRPRWNHWNGSKRLQLVIEKVVV